MSRRRPKGIDYHAGRMPGPKGARRVIEETLDKSPLPEIIKKAYKQFRSGKSDSPILRIIIGRKIVKPTLGKPILLILTGQDIKNIKNMAPGASHYAVFAKDDPDYDTVEKQKRWLQKIKINVL